MLNTALSRPIACRGLLEPMQVLRLWPTTTALRTRVARGGARRAGPALDAQQTALPPSAEGTSFARTASQTRVCKSATGSMCDRLLVHCVTLGPQLAAAARSVAPEARRGDAAHEGNREKQNLEEEEPAE